MIGHKKKKKKRFWVLVIVLSPWSKGALMSGPGTGTYCG